MNYLLPLLTVLIWGGNAIVNKMASHTIEPSAMSFYRWLLAIVLLTPFCLPQVIRQWKDVKHHLSHLAILALLGMVLNQSLGYYAGLTTSASNMALISSLIPLLCVFASVPILKKSVSPASIIGATISLIGLAYMLGHGDILFFLHQQLAQGDILMFAAAVVYAFYCVLLKKWQMPFGNWTLIYLQGVCAVLMLTPLWLSSRELFPSTAALPLIAYAGIGASIIAPWMWVKAIKTLGADSTAMFMNLLPIVTVALAVCTLGETVHLFHFIGGTMVISGVILSQIKVKRRTQVAKIPPISHA